MQRCRQTGLCLSRCRTCAVPTCSARDGSSQEESPECRSRRRGGPAFTRVSTRASLTIRDPVDPPATLQELLLALGLPAACGRFLFPIPPASHQPPVAQERIRSADIFRPAVTAGMLWEGTAEDGRARRTSCPKQRCQRRPCYRRHTSRPTADGRRRAGCEKRAPSFLWMVRSRASSSVA